MVVLVVAEPRAAVAVAGLVLEPMHSSGEAELEVGFGLVEPKEAVVGPGSVAVSRHSFEAEEMTPKVAGVGAGPVPGSRPVVEPGFVVAEPRGVVAGTLFEVAGPRVVGAGAVLVLEIGRAHV